jgi:hypothetical protein
MAEESGDDRFADFPPRQTARPTQADDPSGPNPSGGSLVVQIEAGAERGPRRHDCGPVPSSRREDTVLLSLPQAWGLLCVSNLRLAVKTLGTHPRRNKGVQPDGNSTMQGGV